MKLLRYKIFFYSAVVTSFCITVNAAIASSIDYSFLIGEWSFPGMCDTSRYVYGEDGSYASLSKEAEDSSWQTNFEGIYVIKPEADLVVIAENHNSGGWGFKTLKLNQKTYISTEIIPGEGEGNSFAYEKCS